MDNHKFTNAPIWQQCGSTDEHQCVSTSVDMELVKTVTNRGVQCIVWNNFKYRRQRVMTTVNISWRCTVKNCVATLQTNSDANEIVFIRDEHKHERESEQCIENHIIRNSCKRTAAEDLTTQPRKELCKSNANHIQKRNINSVRISIYRERRKLLPRLPRSTEEALYLPPDTVVDGFVELHSIIPANPQANAFVE
ncbi:hypothetical protein C0J52_25049 [Blattella germanica]|nr:hypothetical protein C0J52_25049 [Blattella germanica]